ncbi:AsmA-like C-terminal region-containing protein [Phocaeicola vulgatus]|uniref:AsmA-like C-terminal region-containing protein n=1 Tax=Phocaeicola vulgatus TaxID=821 RepID=UPI00094224A0|nr:AsmA-like C-terminal region-containing protein [Phocaeicola vulgatus]
MERRIRKLIRVSAITVGALLLTGFVVVAFVINYVFTPDKLTPIVLNVANRSLDADLKVESVELTFFSTFPQFGLKVDEGFLVSKVLNDSLPQKTDSLLAFKECVLIVNPLDYFLKNKISVYNLSLKNVAVYAYRNKTGKANWEIVKTSSDTLAVEKDTISQNKFDSEIDIRQVELEHANLIFDDRNTEVYSRIDDVDLRLKLALTKGVSSLGVEFENKNILFWQQGELLINKVAASLQTDIEIDRSTALWTLKNTGLTINGIRLDVNGELKRDTVTKMVGVNLKYGLHAPSMETVMNMIPEAYVKRGQISAKGEVKVDGTLEGNYGNKQLPAVSLNIKINDASARYEGLPYGIDNFTADFESYIDLMRRNPSFLNLKKQDIGRIRLGGRLALKDFELKDTAKDFNFLGNADLKFSDSETLQAELDIREIILNSRKFVSEIDRMKAKVVSTNPQDTTKIVTLQCELEMNKLRANIGDSLKIYSGKTTGTGELAPKEQNSAMPMISFSMRTDSLFFNANETKLALGVAGIKAKLEKKNDSLWIPRGIVGFDRLLVHTPEFGLPLRVRKTAVTVDGPKITLRNASLKIGHSDMVATGEVMGLYRAMTKNETLKARLAISSEMIDCNQLINSFSLSEDSVSVAVTDTVSPTEMKLFVLPGNLDFELQTDLKKVVFGKVEFEDVCGKVDLKNRTLYLRNLEMRALDADMKAVMVYRADSVRGGYTGFDFKIRDINIAKLVDFIPSMDTIVPMLRSFEGRVQFDVAAEARLDSNMNIRIPTLRSAMYIKGDSLVLMDGETFAEISKMLMFKNKKKNVFDSISVNVVVNDGSVLVYPFQVSIDRYKAAIGGEQGLDMNFKYHISILKSPLPFKAGVNISGNLDKMKIRVGKAKYKDDVTPAAIHKVDSTRMDLGRRIVERFHRIVGVR